MALSRAQATCLLALTAAALLAPAQARRPLWTKSLGQLSTNTYAGLLGSGLSSVNAGQVGVQTDNQGYLSTNNGVALSSNSLYNALVGQGGPDGTDVIPLPLPPMPSLAVDNYTGFNDLPAPAPRYIRRVFRLGLGPAAAPAPLTSLGEAPAAAAASNRASVRDRPVVPFSRAFDQGAPLPRGLVVEDQVVPGPPAPTYDPIRNPWFFAHRLDRAVAFARSFARPDLPPNPDDDGSSPSPPAARAAPAAGGALPVATSATSQQDNGGSSQPGAVASAVPGATNAVQPQAAGARLPGAVAATNQAAVIIPQAADIGTVPGTVTGAGPEPIAANAGPEPNAAGAGPQPNAAGPGGTADTGPGGPEGPQGPPGPRNASALNGTPIAGVSFQSFLANGALANDNLARNALANNQATTRGIPENTAPLRPAEAIPLQPATQPQPADAGPAQTQDPTLAAPQDTPEQGPQEAPQPLQPQPQPGPVAIEPAQGPVPPELPLPPGAAPGPRPSLLVPAPQGAPQPRGLPVPLPRVGAYNGAATLAPGASRFPARPPAGALRQPPAATAQAAVAAAPFNPFPITYLTDTQGNFDPFPLDPLGRPKTMVAAEFAAAPLGQTILQDLGLDGTATRAMNRASTRDSTGPDALPGALLQARLAGLSTAEILHIADGGNITSGATLPGPGSPFDESDSPGPAVGPDDDGPPAIFGSDVVGANIARLAQRRAVQRAPRPALPRPRLAMPAGPGPVPGPVPAPLTAPLPLPAPGPLGALQPAVGRVTAQRGAPVRPGAAAPTPSFEDIISQVVDDVGPLAAFAVPYQPQGLVWTTEG